MTGRDHETWHDTVGAYLLGALPDDEREGYERHLSGCPECRRTVDELRVAVEVLPSSVPRLSAPVALKRRVIGEFEREAALLPDRRGARHEDARSRRRHRLGGLRFAAAAGLAAVALLVGVAAGRWLVDGASDRTIAATVDRTRAPSASVQLTIEGERAVLEATDLPAPPGDRVYQVWVQRGTAAPEPTASLFTPRSDGSATTVVARSLAGVDRVLVSAEPPGGSRAPTTPPLVSVGIS